MSVFLIKAGVWLVITSPTVGFVWFVATTSIEAALAMCVASIAILIWHLVGYEINEKTLGE